MMSREKRIANITRIATSLIDSAAHSTLLRSAGVYVTTSMINSAIPFLMLPILTRYLSPFDYGIVAMFQVLTGIVSTLTGLSTHGAISRQYFEKDKIDFPKYISNCLYILILSSIITAVVLWLLSGWISKYTQFPSSWLWSVMIVSCGQFVILIVLILWQVQVSSVYYGVFQILITSANIGLSLWLIIGLGMGWQGRIQGQVWSYLVFSLVGLYILWKGGWLKWHYEAAYVKNALKFGVPLIPHSLGGWAIGMTDRILITNMIGIVDTGIFVVGAQIGMLIGLFEDAFNRAWVPWFFGQLKKDDPGVNLRIIKITYLYNVLIFFLAIVLAWITPWLLNFFVGSDFKDAGKYVIWIAMGYAFNGMYKMAANYIFYTQKTHLLAWMTFFIALANVGISYVLIRHNGAVGAAQGTMLTFLLCYLITWIVSARVYKMPWNLKV
jgi:O-antigen/teichoic acid export membrane protein